MGYLNKILIVEDDAVLLAGLCRSLRSFENKVEGCGSLKEAREKLAAEQFDLILLDINLPDGDGLDFLVEVRSGAYIPVILLTANDMETDIVNGLELGADDYITKPFRLAVLRARVNTQLRRRAMELERQKRVVKNELEHKLQNNKPGKNINQLGEFYFDFDLMIFKKGEESVELSKTEQKLLRILVENQGITLERSKLVDRIWTDGAEYVDENALSVTIKRLRDKLKAQEYIKTVYGVGYTWISLK